MRKKVIVYTNVAEPTMTPKPCRKKWPALKMSESAFFNLPVMLSAVTGMEASAKCFLAMPPVKIAMRVHTCTYTLS